jgi:hypothetical protein
MSTAKASLVIREWNVKADAAESYDLFEMDIQSMLSGHNAIYLIGPLVGQAAFNPALPVAFVPSMALPVIGYGGLNPANKSLYNQEKSSYDRELKATTDLRNTHEIKCGNCTAYLFSMFKQETVCCKALFSIMKTGLAAVPPVGSGEIFHRMISHISNVFAPNKTTDAAALLLKLSTADFHDGRGLELNISEFNEAFDHLVLMNVAPIPLIMQKNVSSAIHLFPNFNQKLADLRVANDADAIALIAGVALPAIPRWKAMLEQCILDVRAFKEWDYVTKGTSAGYKTKTQPKETTKISSTYDPKAAYCATCGRNGHSADECHARKCICSKPILNGKREHSVKDPAHDTFRREFVPYSKQSSTDPQRKSKEGDRDLSRSNPRLDRTPGEKKLRNQLKTNDKQNARLTKMLEEGKKLVDQNLALRSAIEGSSDMSLTKSMALVPYKASTVFKSSSSSKSKKKRDRDDDEESL